MIKVLLIPDRKVFTIEIEKIKIGELLKKLGFSIDEVATVVNNHIVEDIDYIISSSDDVKLIRVATGG